MVWLCALMHMARAPTLCVQVGGVVFIVIAIVVVVTCPCFYSSLGAAHAYTHPHLESLTIGSRYRPVAGSTPPDSAQARSMSRAACAM